MKIFKIIDEDQNSEIGHILYYEKCQDFIIHLHEGLDEWSAPLLFTKYVKEGVYTIPRDASILWIRERIIPSDRQNIGDILSNARLKSYSEVKLLELSHGKCSQDNIRVELTGTLPDYIKEREGHNLEECFPLDNRNILCFFNDSTVRKIDLSQLSQIDTAINIEKALKNSALFQSAQVGPGGYSMTFDNAIDIPASILYTSGLEIPLTLYDFKLFVAHNVLDTTQASELLECSRQNISYLANQSRLTPVKEDVRGTLYLRGEVVKNSW